MGNVGRDVRPGDVMSSQLDRELARQLEREERIARELDGRPSLQSDDPLLDRLIAVHGVDGKANRG